MTGIFFILFVFFHSLSIHKGVVKGEQGAFAELALVVVVVVVVVMVRTTTTTTHSRKGNHCLGLVVVENASQEEKKQKRQRGRSFHDGKRELCILLFFVGIVGEVGLDTLMCLVGWRSNVVCERHPGQNYLCSCMKKLIQ